METRNENFTRAEFKKKIRNIDLLKKKWKKKKLTKQKGKKSKIKIKKF